MVGMSEFGSGREALFTQNYIIICLINLFIVLSSFPLVTILPVYLRANVTPNTTLTGLIIGIFPFCALLSRFFAGWALDNFRIKPLFAAFLLGYAMLFIVYPFVYAVAPFFDFTGDTRFYFRRGHDGRRRRGDSCVTLKPPRRGRGLFQYLT